MKVTFVLPMFSRRPIGGLRAVYELANGLAALGHAVTVVHPESLPGLARPMGLRGRVLHLLDSAIGYPSVPWMTMDPGVRLAHVASIEEDAIPDADVVVATSWQTAAPVAALPSRKGRKCYLVMDFYPFIAPRATLERSWRSGFRIATISRWLLEMVLEAGVDARDATSISCGVSHPHCMRMPVAGREPSVAIMYGLGSYKAPNDMVEAMEAVNRHLPHVPIRAFGTNASRRPRELPRCVEYRPLLSDQALSDLYNRSAVFASASLAEGFCLPAAEAMASGCLVVATNSGGILDFAVDGENCVLSPPGEPQTLALNIVSALTDEAARHRMALAGVEHIKEFTWTRCSSRLEAFLAEPSRSVQTA